MAMMTEKEIRTNFASNLVQLRKANHMKQSDLAALLSYSDKAISKWETGETMPDIVMVYQIAQVFHVSIDELLTSEKVVHASNKEKRHLFITIASMVGTLMIASITFVVLFAVGISWAYDSFVVGLPIAMVSFVVLSAIWYDRKILFIAVSLLDFSTVFAVMILLSLYPFWWAFLLSSILIDIFLFFLLFIFKKDWNKKKNNE